MACACGGAGLGLGGFHYSGAPGCLINRDKREHLLARLAFQGVELTDSSLALAVAFVDALPRRALTGETLARMQQEREAGIVPPPVDPEAAALGAVLGAIVAEVERANRKHGRTFPGGVGPCGRREDVEAMLRAKDACDAAAAEGRATLRLVLAEEVAEVWAEPAGSPEQRRELCQVAAVAVRGMLVTGSEVQGG